MLNKVEICGVNTSKLPLLSKKEKDELFIKIKNGDEDARNKFINGNLRLVLSVIQRFYGRGENADDLFQVGCVGLIKAIDNFDLSQNVQFSTYAVPMIIGEVKRYLRDNNSIRVSRSVRDLAYKAMQYKEQYIRENGKEPTVEEIKAAIRKGVMTSEFFPVLCGSAYKNKGVQMLLDAVVDYLPAPTDIEAIQGHLLDGEEAVRKPSDDEPFSALAFKIATDPFVGRLTYFRVYSGHASAGSYVLNATKGKRERLGRLVRMHANHRADIEEVYTGDIAGAVGLKFTTTSDTLCAENAPIELMQMVFPEPVIQMSVEPKTKADSQKMDSALQKLAEEDPTFKAYTDEETGQTIIAGVGELQLDIILDRMRREFKVEATAGAPQVAYRETIKSEAEVQGKFVRQSGGHGQYGDVWIRFKPNPGKGFEFEDQTVGGSIPKEFIKPTQAGLEEALPNGLVAGFPVVDIRAELFDGSYHDVDSSEQAYKIAASLALKEAAKKCNPTILEPIMAVDITAPSEYLGAVMGDVTKRRGQIREQEETGNAIKVKAFVPLAEMFGYVTDLRGFTQGRGIFSMQMDHYEEVPKNIAKEIIEAHASK